MSKCFLNLSLILSGISAVWSIWQGESENDSLYEVQLRKVDPSLEEHYLRILSEGRIRENASNFLGVDFTTSSTIPLRVDRQNRLWATHYGTIIIGEDTNDTRFNVLFDTGSSELWIPDELCDSEACRTRKKYHRSKEWKAKYDSNGNYVRIVIKYLSGEIQAIDGTASVSLQNGITLKDVNVGLAKSIDIPVISQVPWDGILGLGLNTSEMKSRGSRPILEAIRENKILYPKFRDQFSYYVSRDGGSITFGGVNDLYKRSPSDEFKWSKVSCGTSYWCLDLEKITIRNSKSRQGEDHAILGPDYAERVIHDGKFGEARVIIDTGTFLIYAPEEMRSFVDSLRITSCKEKSRLPSINFSLDGEQRVDLELSPDDYVLKSTEQDGRERCVLGITVDDQQQELGFSAWTFGEVFLRAYYTVYDYEVGQVGFVPSKRNFA